MPQISVIVPVYNVEKFIHRCVGSILAQTFLGFELILVDDGSPDNCGTICDDYAEKDSRIHVIHKENGGLSSARNAGLDWISANSDSEWVTFVDSDDWVHPNYLSYLLQAANDYSVDLVVSPIIKVNSKEIFQELSFECKEKLSKDVFLGFSKRMTDVSACGKLYKKELLFDIRFPIGKLWEDLHTTYKLFLSTDVCAVVPQKLYFYYVNDEGIIRRNWSPKRMDEFEAYENMLAYFKSKEEYHDLYIAYQEPYIRAISYSYYMCIKSDMSESDIKHYSKLISKKMRKALHMYKKNTNICFKNDKGVYETAYPQLMNYYWFINNKKKQLKGKK